MLKRIKLSIPPVKEPIFYKENILVINKIELTENCHLFCKKILAESYLNTILTSKNVVSLEPKPKKNFFKIQGRRIFVFSTLK